MFGDIGLRGGNAGGENGQPARGVEMRDGSGGIQAFALQQGRDFFAQLTNGGINHSRRNFFATDF